MPVTAFSFSDKYDYHNGFRSYQETEAIKGALPVAANSPQKPPYGLYAEKLSGTAFTAPQHENLQSWLYRILPAAAHSDFVPYASAIMGSGERSNNRKQRYVHSLKYLGGGGNPAMKTGLGIFIFAAGTDMGKEAFYSADGDFLIVLQHGVLDIQTELGHILVRPNEIAVIPRGIRYRVTLPAGPVRSYILELYQDHFQLPELGPIGSKCLANARDFQIPTAAFEEDSSPWMLCAKFDNELFQAHQDHTPFDVVAWHGIYYPYKYDLGRFNVIGSTSFDHPDLSIYTVLTGLSDHAGTAVADFVIFPPRWLVQEDTFRPPPWYRRNTMSEFMGLTHGDYDAKTGGGFKPAGASLHNVMSAHGPDSSTHEKASNAELIPVKIGQGSMAFMFESCLMIGVTDWALEICQKVQPDYNDESWRSLKSNFTRPEI